MFLGYDVLNYKITNFRTINTNNNDKIQQTLI